LSFVVSSDVRQRRFSSSPVNKSSAAPLLTRKPLQHQEFDRFQQSFILLRRPPSMLQELLFVGPGKQVCCGSGCCMNTGFDFIRLHQVRPVSDMKAIT
ncbi:unnamed protein product, partial [Musa hybrid cultivar]